MMIVFSFAISCTDETSKATDFYRHYTIVANSLDAAEKQLTKLFDFDKYKKLGYKVVSKHRTIQEDVDAYLIKEW